MPSEAIRDPIAYKPISTDRDQPKVSRDLVSGEHGATNGDVSLQARVPARVYMP
jgi:hypothetical protein